MNDYDYLIKQLNLIIGFFDVSDENVYNQIRQHERCYVIYDSYGEASASLAGNVYNSL